MTRSVTKLTQTTAIALGLLITQNATAEAQPFTELAGVNVKFCGDATMSVDGGKLGRDAFAGDDTITPQFVSEALLRSEVCVNDEGMLKFSGESAEQVSPEARLEPGESNGRDVTETVETGSEADNMTEIQGQAETQTETATPTPVEPAPGAADTKTATAAPLPVEPAPAEAEVPAVEQPLPGAQAQGEASVDTGEAVTAEGQADAGAVKPIDSSGRAVGETETASVTPTPDAPAEEVEEPAPAALAAGADSDGREAEPAEVTETTVTEETSRSSAEEFANKVQGDAAAQTGSGDRGGLSNLEKFALGAAGIVALDAILGNNREVVSNSGDRVVIRDSSGELEVLRDDDTLLRRPGADVRTETFSDGSTRTTVTRPNGAKVVTIADATGRVIKRTRITADGREIVIIDDTEEVTPVDVTRLPDPPQRRQTFEARDRESLEAALRAQSRAQINRSFTLRQVREYRQVRELMPEISIDAINFATGSSAIQPQEAEELFDLGRAMSDFIAENPDELFLIEGHTDAVGDAAYNLALSDRRAESVALALTEYFNVPPENMIIQGYGESELLIPTAGDERANRRAVVRRITPLLR